MSLLRYATKRDANESDIVAELRAVGLSVYLLDKPLDLLVGYGGKTYLVEVKTAKGKLTPAQKGFIEGWRGQHVIIRTIEEAREWAGKVRENEA